jgi:hypothetical protein
MVDLFIKTLIEPEKRSLITPFVDRNVERVKQLIRRGMNRMVGRPSILRHKKMMSYGSSFA